MALADVGVAASDRGVAIWGSDQNQPHSSVPTAEPFGPTRVNSDAQLYLHSEHLIDHCTEGWQGRFLPVSLPNALRKTIKDVTNRPSNRPYDSGSDLRITVAVRPAMKTLEHTYLAFV